MSKPYCFGADEIEINIYRVETLFWLILTNSEKVLPYCPHDAGLPGWCWIRSPPLPAIRQREELTYN